MKKLTESEVIGMFKSTGSRDVDVLAAHRLAIIGSMKALKFLSVGSMVLGVLLTVTVIAAILGIPLFIFGLWQHGRCKKNIALIETVFARLTASVPTPPSATGVAMPQTSM